MNIFDWKLPIKNLFFILIHACRRNNSHGYFLYPFIFKRDAHFFQQSICKNSKISSFGTPVRNSWHFSVCCDCLQELFFLSFCRLNFFSVSFWHFLALKWRRGRSLRRNLTVLVIMNHSRRDSSLMSPSKT